MTTAATTTATTAAEVTTNTDLEATTLNTTTTMIATAVSATTSAKTEEASPTTQAEEEATSRGNVATTAVEQAETTANQQTTEEQAKTTANQQTTAEQQEITTAKVENTPTAASTVVTTSSSDETATAEKEATSAATSTMSVTTAEVTMETSTMNKNPVTTAESDTNSPSSTVAGGTTSNSTEIPNIPQGSSTGTFFPKTTSCQTRVQFHSETVDICMMWPKRCTLQRTCHLYRRFSTSTPLAFDAQLASAPAATLETRPSSAAPDVFHCTALTLLRRPPCTHARFDIQQSETCDQKQIRS